MKNDLALRFADEAEAVANLSQLRETDKDGKAVWATASHNFDLDVIGPLCTAQPVLDGMKVVSGPVMDNRFHVNLLTNDDKLAATLQPFVINPGKRLRVWQS